MKQVNSKRIYRIYQQPLLHHLHLIVTRQETLLGCGAIGNGALCFFSLSSKRCSAIFVDAAGARDVAFEFLEEVGKERI